VVVERAGRKHLVTTAEHNNRAVGSMARNVPQAHAKLLTGVWDKKSFIGAELNGKRLGVIGLGRIGRHAAKSPARDVDFSTTHEGATGKRLGNLKLERSSWTKRIFITIHTPVTGWCYAELSAKTLW